MYLDQRQSDAAPRNGLTMLHVAARRSQVDPDGPLGQALRELGELGIVEQGRDLSDDEVLRRMREADVLITNWASRPIPPALAENPGRVRYVLNLGGTCRATVPVELIRNGIQVTNWGDTPAVAIAEGAMALLLAVLKDLRGRTESIAAGGPAVARGLGLPSGTLCGLRVGVYGCGAIGRRFVGLVRPFEPDLSVHDPYAEELPDGCAVVDTLDELFDTSEAVIVLAGLTPETRGSIDAARLARLPDHGIVINVARAEIIDQPALFAELKAGRLRAGLDVYGVHDGLPADHEARTWPNLLLTSHDINSAHWPDRPRQLSYADRIALENIRRYRDGRPLQFVMDERRYELSS